MNKQIIVEKAQDAISRINYLSNLPKEQRAKELKHIDNIVENHKKPYDNKRQGFKFPLNRKEKIKAVFHSRLDDVQFRLNIHKQPNGRITLDIPKQYTNEFKDGQLIIFRLSPLNQN